MSLKDGIENEQEKQTSATEESTPVNTEEKVKAPLTVEEDKIIVEDKKTPVLKKKSNGFSSIYGFLGFGALLVAFILYFSFGYSVSIFSDVNNKIDSQLQTNTIQIQKVLTDAVHTIDMFEATENPNYISLLQSDIAVMVTTLEQSAQLYDATREGASQTKDKLLHTLEVYQFFLEENSKGTISLSTEEISHIGDNLFIFSSYLAEVSPTDYMDLVSVNNQAFTQLQPH